MIWYNRTSCLLFNQLETIKMFLLCYRTLHTDRFIIFLFSRESSIQLLFLYCRTKVSLSTSQRDLNTSQLNITFLTSVAVNAIPFIIISTISNTLLLEDIMSKKQWLTSFSISSKYILVRLGIELTTPTSSFVISFI